MRPVDKKLEINTHTEARDVTSYSFCTEQNLVFLYLAPLKPGHTTSIMMSKKENKWLNMENVNVDRNQ